MTTKALIILSGGQDSTTCLFWAKQYFDEIHALTFNYGQRHSIEIQAAKAVAGLAGVHSHVIIDIPNILLSKSPLLNTEVPLETYSNAEQMDRVIGDRRELTFVPMRNALFLTIAANRAEVLGYSSIVTGVCQMDNANYDDCRRLFIDNAENYINTALGHDHRGTPDIAILTPLMNYSKAETVELATRLPGCWEALAYTHTSYDGSYPPTHPNHANILRADGFEKAGLPDPLVVRAYREGRMKLPPTANYDILRNSRDDKCQLDLFDFTGGV
jgi:7-cyano-7-deazaguanine synthase